MSLDPDSPSVHLTWAGCWRNRATPGTSSFGAIVMSVMFVVLPWFVDQSIVEWENISYQLFWWLFFKQKWRSAGFELLKYKDFLLFFKHWNCDQEMKSVNELVGQRDWLSLSVLALSDSWDSGSWVLWMGQRVELSWIPCTQVTESWFKTCFKPQIAATLPSSGFLMVCGCFLGGFFVHTQ